LNWKHKIGIYPWRSFTEIKLLQSGHDFFSSLTATIQTARHEILFQVYIFELDECGRPLWEALCQAANRGVEVTMWLDAYGSANFLTKLPQLNLPPNLKIHFYSPIKFFKNQSLGMRLHHKIMVFDYQHAFIGGINVSNHYKGTKQELPWLDYAVELTGEICNDLRRICLRTGSRFKRVRVEPKVLNETMLGSNRNPKNIRVLENNWFKGKFAIGRQYKAQTRICKEELWIINSYFVPSNALIRLLKKAAKRGVNINLILSGKSDVKLVKNATEYFYNDLLIAGVNIYQYHESVLHAKLAFSDNNWLCIGSYNLNHLSDFGSIECNIEMQHPALALAFKQQVLDFTLPRCEKFVYDSYYQKLSFVKRSINFCSFQMLRLALTVLFFFQKNSKKLSHKE
jgi:cardiolipin synthase A/B